MSRASWRAGRQEGSEAVSRKPHKSRAFLQWAKRQGGLCCVCAIESGNELHHIEKVGMSQKGSDLLVARVCHGCHGYVQGKYRLAFERFGELCHWADLQADALELLAGYVEHLEAK